MTLQKAMQSFCCSSTVQSTGQNCREYGKLMQHFHQQYNAMVCDIASDDLSLISTVCVYAFIPPWKESSVQIWLVCHLLYVVMLSNFVLDAVFQLVACPLV